MRKLIFGVQRIFQRIIIISIIFGMTMLTALMLTIRNIRNVGKILMILLKRETK